MKLMWSYDRAVPADVLLRDLWRYGTVSPALVTRLLKKLRKAGWLRRELADGIYVYDAAVPRKDYVDRLMRDVVASGRNSPSAFVLQLPSTPSAQRRLRCTTS